MTSQSRTLRARMAGTESPNPFSGLIELILGLLLHDVPQARGAQLSLVGEPPGWVVGNPAIAAHLVTAKAPIAGDGPHLTLTVGTDRPDDAITRVQLERFIPLVVECVRLELRQRELTGQAVEAVAAIERMVVLDLATGVMMARRNCDLRTARALALTWSADEGVDLETASPADVLERLTAAIPRGQADPHRPGDRSTQP